MNFTQAFDKLYLNVIFFSEKIFRVKFWNFIYTIIVSIFCLITALPSKENLDKNHLETLSYQIKNPFKPIPKEFTDQDKNQFDGSKSHLDKIGFRFMIPLIGNLFNLNYYQIIYLQIISFSFFFFFLLRFFQNNNFDTTTLILSPLLFATTFIGKWGLFDVWYFDGFAYLFILITICRYSILVTFLSGLSACFIDERALMALLIVLFYYFRIDDTSKKVKYKNHSVVIIFVFLCYFLIRVYLERNFGIITGNSAIGSIGIHHNFQFIPLTIFSVFEFSVLVFIPTFFYLKSKNVFDLLVFLSLIFLFVLVSHLVFDVSRSLAYGFPLLMIGLVQISKSSKTEHFQKLLIVIIALNLLIPTYSFCANFTLLKPLFFDELNEFLRTIIEKVFI